MMVRLLLLLGLGVAGVFAQPNLYGPVSTHLRAGDFAPEIVFTQILSQRSASPWTSESLSGQISVLVFYPDTSHNLQSVSRWNALVEKFAGKPIQFAWITGEKESTLLPWIEQHPVKGWVFYDPDGATGRAFGLEMPAAVIVGADRRIAGFDDSMLPESETLTAALAGRITTAPPELTPAALKAFAESGLVRLQAESPRMPRPDDYKPDFPPSYTVHISPAKSQDAGDFADGAFHSLQSVTLRTLISQLYEINPIRVRLSAALDNDKHYDVAIVLPDHESEESVDNRILQGVQDYFGVAAARQQVLSDVYVVTTAGGKPPTPVAHADDDSGFSGAQFGSVDFQTPDATLSPGGFQDWPKPVALDAVRGISVEGTLDEFCRMLEMGLDRPVVNETNMQGQYAFQLKSAAGAHNDFLDRLHGQFNLSITPAQRRVEVVTLTPR
ncbi:MAG: TIGR03435 family protein [Bryobacteraceae bacterium]